MDDIKDKRKRNIAIEAALKSIKQSLSGKHARGIMNNIESNIRYAYRRGYEDAQDELKRDEITITLNELEPEIYTVSWIARGVPVVTSFSNYDAAKACYDYFKKTNVGKCIELDKMPVYNRFLED